MAGTKEIKQRIRSVKNTKKITKAMELVAASKMKRAVSKALSSKLYARYSWDILVSISERLEEINSPFFKKEESKIDEFYLNPEKNLKTKTLFVLISSNSGLCGSYNSQIIKKIIEKLKEIDNSDFDIITIGKKGDNAMRKVGANIIASFIDMPDNFNIKDISPVFKIIMNEFKEGKYKNVYIAYTDFISAINQKADIKKILPITKDKLKKFIDNIGDERNKSKNIQTKKIPYIFDGDKNKLLDDLAEKLVRMQIYQMILESTASEQSSRMMAMKNASEAAGEMIDDLTLVFNKARQANITQEISEISAGMASVK